ncbi:hypothetical protein VDBG_00525 [Verticillium alfalfae VaMs.102]|uniref:Uncharacterized protein n=1 Tax=Verticillium alfalfae (strain VaMs.102 / ATCC MYA-4576 / FGSC 10136) TaxID=526221 RepID=C9S6A5_VERA1|nr:hypothetical protein VDBG_00525 [Verticillium alfalfae VaMs.102]EEY14417.1 hypothetical protein VDBG_00525 [Verticillium alfalfae VaMs.102]
MAAIPERSRTLGGERVAQLFGGLGKRIGCERYTRRFASARAATGILIRGQQRALWFTKRRGDDEWYRSSTGCNLLPRTGKD